MPHAKIATTQASFSLLQLHAELGGKIIDNKRDAKRLADSMRHVEAVLKMLDPAFSARGISVRRRKPNRHFKRGTIFRAVLEILKVADEPLTTSEIVRRLFVAKGVTDPSPDDTRVLFGGVQASLRNHRGGSIIAHTNGRSVRWSLQA